MSYYANSAPARGIRRVVTGHDSDGKAVFLSDAEVEPFEPSLVPGSKWDILWQADSAPTFPRGGRPGAAPLEFFPPVGGFRFFISTTPPGQSASALADDALEAALAEYERHLPGLLGALESDGAHTTDTVDMHLLLSGEVELELDEGARTVLHAGDVFVLNGTRHRWTVHGAQPAVVATFMAGAKRTP